ncbi:MAG TPA: DUF433 domain-containing protein [Acidimicrobiales bacterium]
MRRVADAFEGCYEAERAAALAGVPVSTLYEWARAGLVVPSLSPARPMLWSYADLVVLRIVGWLRHPKRAAGAVVPASPMAAVRRALDELDRLGLDPWAAPPDGAAAPDGPATPASPLAVDRSGNVYVRHPDGVQGDRGQGVLPDTLDLLGPFDGEAGGWGPDLRRPLPHLRIVPGKLSGEPHLAGSRVTTRAVAALADRGHTLDDLARLYPDEDADGLREAVELERRLAA